MHLKDYSQHLREASYCGSRWRILHLRDNPEQQPSEDIPRIRVIPTRCNSKACPSCQLRFYRKIRSKLLKASVSDKWRMFTLTLRHTPGKEAEELLHLEASFRKLRKKLRRNFKDFRYFAVKELSPSGMWHIHGIFNVYLPLKELSTLWTEASGSYRCWISQVRNPRSAIRYIFKYCFKSASNRKELQMLYENDKRKFSYSKGLLAKDATINPYTCEFASSYSVHELKEKLFEIIRDTRFAINDFFSTEYPYFQDLILNLFEKFYYEHPPGLFSTT